MSDDDVLKQRKYRSGILTWKHVERYPYALKEHYLEFFQGVVGVENLEYYAVGLEEHGDDGEGAQWPDDHVSGGGPEELPPSVYGWHIHLAYRLKKEKQLRGKGKGGPFIYEGIYPNVTPAKKGTWGWQAAIRGAVKYVNKEDKNPLTNIPDIEKFINTVDEKGVGGDAVVVGILMEPGKGPRDVYLSHPIEYYRNAKKIKEFYEDKKMFDSYVAKKPWVPFPLEGLHGPCLRIGMWLLKNMGQDRPHKQKQLYIYSDEADCGKSSLLKELTNYFKCWVPKLKGDMKGYDDNETEAIFIDEFRGFSHIIEATDLNRMLEGGLPYTMNVKFGSVTKTKNQPIIICGNYPMSSWYPGSKDYRAIDTLRARLEEVHIPSGVKLYPLIDRIAGKPIVFEEEYPPPLPSYPPLGGAMSADPPELGLTLDQRYEQYLMTRKSRPDDDSDDDALW